MITFPINDAVPPASPDMRALEKDLRRKIQAMESEAEDLRGEAEDLESAATKLQRQLDAMKAGGSGLVEAGQIAVWMLSLSSRLRFGPWVVAALGRAAEQNEIRIVRAVATWYGIGLPAECWPSIPSPERIARVASTTAGLELFEVREAA